MLGKAKIFSWKLIFHLKDRLKSGDYLLPVMDYFKRGGNCRGRALLIYRTIPFHLAPSHPAFHFHQSMVQSLLIAKALDQLGFSVDVLDHSEPVIPPRDPYDIVICHNSEADSKLPQFAGATKIYLASGTEHRTHNLRQQQRVEAFESRMGHHEIELKFDTEKMPWTENAEAIFCFGNEAVSETWRARFGCPVLPFQNTALKELADLPRRWHSESRHFLFLGSRQQLAKGLDLLLEAFAESPDLHLHVCGHYLKDKAFCSAYRDLLFRRTNIHSHGWVDVTSRSFLKVAALCGFTISATCAEGSPGSITNAMRLGMIPILSPEAGLDGGDGVIILHDVSISGISAIIKQCAAEAPDRLRELSDLAVSRAKRDFTEKTFEQRWIEMLTEVLSGSSK